MRRTINRGLFALLLLLSSISSYGLGIGYLPGIEEVGIRQDSDTPVKTIPASSLPNIKTLFAGSTSVTSNHYYRFVLMGAGTNGANYQVTNGKNLYCDGMWAYNSSTGVNLGLQLGYGTAAVTDDGTSAPAGQVQFGNATTRTLTVGITTNQGTYKFFPFHMVFPSQSYPYIFLFNSIEFGVTMLCEEQ